MPSLTMLLSRVSFLPRSTRGQACLKFLFASGAVERVKIHILIVNERDFTTVQNDLVRSDNLGTQNTYALQISFSYEIR